MKAKQDITILSKNGIIISSAEADAILSIKSTLSGDITIRATGEAVEGAETTVNVGQINPFVVNGGYFYNEAEVSTNSGNVLIMANGYVKRDLNALVAENKDKFNDIDTHVDGGIKVSVYSSNAADIIVNGGSALIAGGYSVATQGDIKVNKERVGTGDTEIMFQQGGDLAIYSEKGHIFLYDLPKIRDDDANSRNILEAEGDMFYYCPKGGFFNNKDMHVVDGDIALNVGRNMVSIKNSIVTDNGNIEITAMGGIGIQALVSAKKGMVTLGSQKGDMRLNGTLIGEKVVLYTEDKDAKIYFNDIYADEELVVISNHIGDDGVLDMSKVHSDNENFVLNLYGVDGTMSGDYVVDYRNFNQPVHLNQLVVRNLVLFAQGPVKIEDIFVENRADIYSMGTKTSIYGKVQEYDQEAQFIYYHNSHDAERIGDDGKFYNGMSLEILSGDVQKTSSILLKKPRGYSVYGQRDSVVSVMQNLLGINIGNVFNATFNNNVQSFSRFDNVAIPDVVVNSAEDLDKGEFEF